MEQALAGFLACLEGSGLSVRTVRLTEMRSSWRFLVTALDYAGRAAAFIHISGEI